MTLQYSHSNSIPPSCRETLKAGLQRCYEGNSQATQRTPQNAHAQDFIFLYRLLGVPLLPPAWQVRLGEERPERPPAQIARLEQALPQVFPEVAPDGVPPPVQQQGPQSQENEVSRAIPDFLMQKMISAEAGL